MIHWYVIFFIWGMLTGVVFRDNIVSWLKRRIP